MSNITDIIPPLPKDYSQDYEVDEAIGDVSPSMMAIARFMSFYTQPFIFGFGLLGNLFSFVIFLSKSMRKISSNLYLAALSGSSYGFNMVLLFQWLEMVRVNIIHMQGFCQAIVYLGYVFSFLSVWFIVCITVENYIVTFHLSKAVVYCTVVRAQIVILVLVLYAVVLYSGQLLTTTVVNFEENISICTENQDHSSLNRVYYFWDTITTIVLPIIITTSLIVAILTKNLCMDKQQKSRDNSIKRRLSKKQKSLVRITRVLLAISITFVILSGPSHANKLRHLIVMETQGRKAISLSERLLQQILQVVYYLSFCLNFVYYLIWSNNFRNEAKRLLCMKRQRRRSCSSKSIELRRKSENLHNGHNGGLTDKSNNHTEKITIL